MYKLLFLISAAIALVSCQQGPSLGPGDDDHLASAAETDCGFIQNSYGQRVSWKLNIPVVLQLHSEYPPEYDEVIKRAAQHWNDAAGMTLFRFDRTGANLGPEVTRNATNTVHWMKTWPEAQKTLQAVTNLYWRGNQIYESDIAVDHKYFNFFVDKATTPYDVHLESLMIHELGHVLGLKHRTVPSVMWSTLNGAVKRDSLTAADRETIKCEY